jgi:hypothetical protein
LFRRQGFDLGKGGGEELVEVLAPDRGGGGHGPGAIAGRVDDRPRP